MATQWRHEMWGEGTERGETNEKGPDQDRSTGGWRSDVRGSMGQD